MEYKCPTCGCSCGYDNKPVIALDSTLHQYLLRTENLSVEGSAPLQCSSVSLSDTLTTSTQRTDAASGRTNELSEANDVQGSTLDVMYKKLTAETLPDGFVCNRMSDKILLYKLDVSRGLIAIECGTILRSEFLVGGNSFNTDMPVNNNEDQDSQEKGARSISQLLTLLSRLNNCEQERSTESNKYCFDEVKVKIESDSETLSAVDSTGELTDEENETLQGGRQVTSEPILPACSVQLKHEDITSALKSGSVRVRRRSAITARRHRCVMCQKYFGSFMILRRHIQRKHVPNRPHACTQCDQSYSLADDLIRHVERVHKERKYKCEKCDYTCDDSSSLLLHVSAVHVGQKTHECPHCVYSSEIRCNLELHIKAVHLKVKPFKCSECPKAFSRKAGLLTHVDAVHKSLKPYSCTQCDSRFSDCYQRRRHVLSVHLKVKPYICSVCSKTFSELKNCQRHEEEVHRGSKPFQCQLCSRCFSQKSSLKTHMKGVH